LGPSPLSGSVEEAVEKVCSVVMPEGRQSYPPDLMDREWSWVSWFIPTPKPGGRPPKQERREIVTLRQG